MEMGTIFLRPGLKEDLVVVTRYLDDISDEGGTLGTGGKMGPWRSQGAIGIEGGWQKDAGGGPCVEGRHGRREEGVGSAVTSDRVRWTADVGFWTQPSAMSSHPGSLVDQVPPNRVDAAEHVQS